MYQPLKAFFTKGLIAASGAFDNVEQLVEGLRRMDTAAVEHVMQKVEPSIRNLVRKAQLPESLTRDVIHDALVILVKKIRDNCYNPDESAPSTYLIGIAKNLISNHLRQSRSVTTASLEQAAEIADDYTQAYLEGRERRDMLESLLGQLGDPCAKLIKLKYLDGYRDEEILSQKMTHYNTSIALRSKRSKCFQKLMELASATKFKNATISPREHQGQGNHVTRDESRY